MTGERGECYTNLMYNKEYQKEGICSRCGKELSGQQKRWCSRNCSRLGLKREYKKRNPEAVRRWKKTQNKFIRHINSKKSRKLRAFNNCKRCGVEEVEKLHVHHIKQRSKGGDNKENNLMVLCSKCHILWHRRMDGYWI